MSEGIEFFDPESEKTRARRRRALILAAIAALSILGYPMAREYSPKWQALIAARKLALFLSALKKEAISTRTPREANFRPPDQIEVAEVSSCGPNAQRVIVSQTKLSQDGVRFVSGTKEPVLTRYCYDPLFGSSVHADGLAHGAIFLAHERALGEDRADHAVAIVVEGASGDLTIE